MSKANRDDALYGDFIKVALPLRVGVRMADGSYRVTARNHAEAFFTGTNVMIQGAHVNVVSVSEEKAVAGGANYDPATFADVLEYCVAHEIFHLIGGRHGITPNKPPDQPGPIMGVFPPLAPDNDFV